MKTAKAGTWLLIGAIVAACGGGEVAGPTPVPVVVAVSPRADTVTVGTRTTFTATVTGIADTGVTWSLLEGSSAGSLSAGGVYTAGTTPGTYRIVASSSAHPQSRDTVTVLVVPAPSAAISVADSVLDSQTGLRASVPSLSGARYVWTVTPGSVATGQGTYVITFASGSPGSVTVNCMVTNLADSAVTGSRQVAVVAGPVITAFTAVHDSVTVGTGTTLTPVFANGSGSVSPGIGGVTSGTGAPVGPFSPAYVGTRFTLAVVGFRGATRSAALTIVPVNPPVLSMFQALGTLAPVGGHGYLAYGWHNDPGVTGAIRPRGIGQ